MIFEAPKHWVLPISNIERDVNPNIEQNNGYWVLPGSADAVTWENVHSWGAPHDIPSWMIETSAYANTLDGAIDLSNAMYIALRYGMWAGQWWPYMLWANTAEHESPALLLQRIAWETVEKYRGRAGGSGAPRKN